MSMLVRCGIGKAETAKRMAKGKAKMTFAIPVAVSALAFGISLGISDARAFDASAMGGQQGSSLPHPTDEFDFVPGEVLIGFDVPATQQQLADLAATVPQIIGYFPPYTYRLRHGLQARGLTGRKPAPQEAVHPLALRRKIKLASDADVVAVAAMLQAMPGVAWASPNGRTHPAYVPNDPRYNQQYGPQIIGAEDAWDIILGGSNAIVLAVADSGHNFSHEDVNDGAVWINHDEIPNNGIDDDNNGFIDDWRGWDFMNRDNSPNASSSHGTHVAGIAAARIDNLKGIAGIAGNVKIMPLQVFQGSRGTWEAIELAIIYATDNGAHVVNYSGGGGGGAQGLSRAVQYAWDNGVTVVAAAGNNNSSTPFYPAAYPPVLAISGTDRNDRRYSGSNFGNWIDVAAPAVSVYSCLWPGTNTYGNKTGTSMARPHAAGLVALMYSINPRLTPADVRQRLRDNAVDLGAPGFDPQFGWGRIDAAATMMDVWQNGGCANLDSHSAVGKRGRAKSFVQTNGAVEGKVFVECVGDGGTFSKKRKVKQDGSAKVKLKELPAGLYTCSVTKLKDAGGAKLCQGAVRPVNVSVK